VTLLRALVLAAIALAGFATATASASSTQESVLMDDSRIVYAGSADELDKTLAEVKALGFDRVRVSVYWRLLAPDGDKQQKPASSYPASDPRFYGPGKWDRYDRIASLAAKHGLGVLFTLTGPSPSWATGTPAQHRTDVEDSWDPSAAEFKDFATAVGTRYSGTWRDEHEEPAVVPLLPPVKTMGPPLPRVDHWSVWNEPNHGGWLAPQWNGSPLVPQSPRIYRGLVDAAWSGLQGSGHQGDTILIGETAPRGLQPGLTRGLHPLRFVRELYCLNGKSKAYTGAAAQKRGCPASFDAAGFAAAHPGLFGASGWAHHPYSLTSAPRVRDKNRDDATLSGVPRLTRTLDRAFKAYGQRAKLPVWMTEYGYQTNPPDPTIGVSFSRQADWLGQATALAYRNPRIASFAQFLLVDDGPIKQYKPNDPRYWGTFQTGLVTGEGRHKTAYESFKRPIAVSPQRVRAGHAVRVIGQLRTAAAGQALTADVQFRARGAKKWSRVARVAVAGQRAFADTKVKATRSGTYRIAWSGDGASRGVEIRVLRPRRP
jgi:hypothetical protein